MVTPELKWPTTNLTPSPANLLATPPPAFGAETSSPPDVVIFWPMMPPAALMSSTACSVPFLSCAPKAAFGPVIGPAMPTLICACAEPANAIAAPSASPSVVILFIRISPCDNGTRPSGANRRRDCLWPRLKRQTPEKSPGIGPFSRYCGGSPRPAQPSRRRIDPAVLRRHLGDAGRAEAEEPEDQAYHRVHGVELGRQQRAVEQREMDETHPGPENQHVAGDVQPGPPGGRDGAAGQPCGPPAHEYGHQQEQPDVFFLVEDAAHLASSAA